MVCVLVLLLQLASAHANGCGDDVAGYQLEEHDTIWAGEDWQSYQQPEMTLSKCAAACTAAITFSCNGFVHGKYYGVGDDQWEISATGT